MRVAETLKSRRIFDIAVALAGLLLFSPLLFTIMALILLEDGRGFKVTCLLQRRYVEQQSIYLDSAIVLLSFMVNIFGKRRVGLWLNSLRNKQRRKRSVRRVAPIM
jgi:lipopolysaccharide/colanic/teichoic acid biosynthesis glycosyltransferase